MSGSGKSSRSTVGTGTEIFTYLRMLFSRCGRPFVGWSHRFSFNHPDGMCPACKGLGKRIAVDVDRLLDLDRSIEEGAIRELPRIGLDRPFQLRRAPVGAAPDLPLGPRGEPPFDLVEPGGAVRREVQLEPPQRPPPTRRS